MLRGEVEFKGVEFAYPSRPENMIFKDFISKFQLGRLWPCSSCSGHRWDCATKASNAHNFISQLPQGYDTQATSALDSESECIVQEALNKASLGRTIIIVSHCLSIIRHADLIDVVQDGQVMEIGSHDELMVNENGFYLMLVQLQDTEQEQVHEKDTSTNVPVPITKNDFNDANDHQISIASSTSSRNEWQG
ncbi:Nucleus isoform 1 [Hibiscus syriacus]|uniref:Nucleus isoform 1 n=1 Tax=Hibiscus syriacus TaxID=106335 RepID=A0A6A2YSG9_HIBSY|nr:Nucleus isoform 1 [Hibiscus syriacus]